MDGKCSQCLYSVCIDDWRYCVLNGVVVGDSDWCNHFVDPDRLVEFFKLEANVG